jgi:hypothetical protein
VEALEGGGQQGKRWGREGRGPELTERGKLRLRCHCTMEEAEEQLRRGTQPTTAGPCIRDATPLSRLQAHRQGIGWHALTPALEAKGAAPVALVGKQTNTKRTTWK